MPRGGRSRGRSFSPVRPAQPRTVAQPAPVPQRAPMPTQQQPMGVGQPRQPGLLGQMAATAGGVAIGSAVGHTIGAAMTGGHQPQQQPDVTYQEQQQQPQQQQQQQGPCQYELQQFLRCAETQGDLTLCDAFNMVLKDCKRASGLS